MCLFASFTNLQKLLYSGVSILQSRFEYFRWITIMKNKNLRRFEFKLNWKCSCWTITVVHQFSRHWFIRKLETYLANTKGKEGAYTKKGNVKSLPFNSKVVSSLRYQFCPISLCVTFHPKASVEIWTEAYWLKIIACYKNCCSKKIVAF